MRTLTLALAAGLLAAAAPAPLGHEGKIDWIKSPEFGIAKAKLEGRVAMLFFTADW